MIEKLLSPEIQSFIHQHENDDERMLVLKQKLIHGVSSALVANQIMARRKAKDKIPTYYNAPDILYPPVVNLEQSSSELTAKYKCEIIKNYLQDSNLKGETLVDLTGGFGVDSFFLSKLFDVVDYVEPNMDLLEIAKHDHEQLGASNINHINTTAEHYVSEKLHQVTIAFIDPSRRSEAGKIFRFADCLPNIINLQEKILEHSSALLIKASPLLDIQQGIKELKYVKTVFVVSIYNECKELLFLCERDHSTAPEVKTINITSASRETFDFTFSSEKTTIPRISNIKRYLYEPNSSILKSGAFKSLPQYFNLFTLHNNTRLYTSDELVNNFPGRIFEVENMIKSNAADALKYFKEGKANIISRNYPLSVDELKKKLKLSDGGEQYLLAFTTQEGKSLIGARRLK